MHSQNFHSQLIRPPFPRGSRLNKIHPRGNPAIVRSIPAVFPQYSYPLPRETRGFRGIPAVPIPVHTSTRESCTSAKAKYSSSVRSASRSFGPLLPLPPDYIFQPVAIETLGPVNVSALNFLSEVGRRLTSLSGDSRETSFLFQRICMLIQRFNSALITDSFCFSDEDPDL